MKQFILLFVFLLTLLSSCCNKTCQKLTDNNPLDSLVLVDTTEMKSAFLGCIHRFIKQYPKDSTFILKCGYGYEDRGIFTNGVYINSDVFLIYPAYYDAFMDGGWTVDDMYPSHYFKIDNRIVFLCSRSDSFMKQEKYRKAYHQIVSDRLRKHYEDLAFILVEHKDNKATLLSSSKLQSLRMSHQMTNKLIKQKSKAIFI
ncbi:putative lipoprotein [Prevotella sp. ICM33]|uniref:hypothetical protein n=1 Tax=Prevotella sp. ICM33 TaxID=1161412 RepID=UPI00044AAB52|nr:hypothetical protein [Prevotella sp. ICM33]ETS99588.1 putative lipoprotein [Prevotella sp. ICM33]